MTGGFGRAGRKSLIASETIPFGHAVDLVPGHPDQIMLATPSGEIYGVAEQGNKFVGEDWDEGEYVPVLEAAGEEVYAIAGIGGFTEGDELTSSVGSDGVNGKWVTATGGANMGAIAMETATLEGQGARIQFIGSRLHHI
jgi:hypothetical protein